jgi:hypothetical protein
LVWAKTLPGSINDACVGKRTESQRRGESEKEFCFCHHEFGVEELNAHTAMRAHAFVSDPNGKKRQPDFSETGMNRPKTE